MKLFYSGKSWLVICCTVLAAALLVRIPLFLFWLDSPIRYYSHVGGLDMKTLLILGTAFFHGNSMPFAVYKLIIAAVLFFAPNAHLPTVLIPIQLAAGCVTGIMTAWICLKLTGKRWAAVAAGCMAALYAPALIYESITLRESIFAFVSCLALATLLWVRRRRYPVWGLLLLGSIICWPMLVRFSALLWTCFGLGWSLCYLWHKYHACRKAFLRKSAYLCLGAAITLGSVSLFNKLVADSFLLPATVNVDYIVELGKIRNPQSVNLPAQEDDSSALKTGWTGYAANLGIKLTKIFKQYEIPNNVNYYFMRDKLWPCSVLPGPGLLIPFAVCGIILLLLRRRFMKKEGILLLYVIAFAIPMSVFVPLGRYRLILYPVFCIAALEPLLVGINIYRTEKLKPRVLKLAGIVILLAGIYYFTLPASTGLRASDYITHGKALQYGNPDSLEAAQCFEEAYRLAPTSPSVAINFTDILLKYGKPREALRVIYPVWLKHPDNEGVALFTAIALLANGKPDIAEQVLIKAGAPKEDAQKTFYYYNLGEAYRMQGRRDAAIAAYRDGLKYAQGEQQKKILNQAIAGIEK